MESLESKPTTFVNTALNDVMPDNNEYILSKRSPSLLERHEEKKFSESPTGFRSINTVKPTFLR